MRLSANVAFAVLATATLSLLLPVRPVAAQELITNGDFETGNLISWTNADNNNFTGTFYPGTNGGNTPFSGFSTQTNPNGGLFIAVSDQGGPGARTLSQSFTTAPGSTVIVSWDMFVNSYADIAIDPAGLDPNAAPNQHTRVDILSASSGPFDTGGGVLFNLYLGGDTAFNGPNPWITYSQDISAVVGGGGNYILRFAEVDNQLYLNMGVDNVSVFQSGGGDVPEPGALATGIALFGSVGLGVLRGRRRKP